MPTRSSASPTNIATIDDVGDHHASSGTSANNRRAMPRPYRRTTGGTFGSWASAVGCLCAIPLRRCCMPDYSKAVRPLTAFTALLIVLAFAACQGSGDSCEDQTCPPPMIDSGIETNDASPAG
jgi:hypothetical protein